MSPVNNDKSTSWNGLPTKVLKQFKNKVSIHLADIFYLSFSPVVFLSILIRVKLGHKNRIKALLLKLYANFFFLSNIDKIIEKNNVSGSLNSWKRKQHIFFSAGLSIAVFNFIFTSKSDRDNSESSWWW